MGAGGNAEVVIGIDMTRLCRELGVLPYAGGLFDQPWIVVDVIKMVVKADQDREKRDKEKRRAPQ